MSKSSKHIDQLYQEQLGDYTEMPPASVWESLELRLDEENDKGGGFGDSGGGKGRPRFPLRWWWVLLGLLLLVGTAVGIDKFVSFKTEQTTAINTAPKNNSNKNTTTASVKTNPTTPVESGNKNTTENDTEENDNTTTVPSRNNTTQQTAMLSKQPASAQLVSQNGQAEAIGTAKAPTTQTIAEPTEKDEEVVETQEETKTAQQNVAKEAVVKSIDNEKTQPENKQEPTDAPQQEKEKTEEKLKEEAQEQQEEVAVAKEEEGIKKQTNITKEKADVGQEQPKEETTTNSKDEIEEQVVATKKDEKEKVVKEVEEEQISNEVAENEKEVAQTKEEPKELKEEIKESEKENIAKEAIVEEGKEIAEEQTSSEVAEEEKEVAQMKEESKELKEEIKESEKEDAKEEVLDVVKTEEGEEQEEAKKEAPEEIIADKKETPIAEEEAIAQLEEEEEEEQEVNELAYLSDNNKTKKAKQRKAKKKKAKKKKEEESLTDDLGINEFNTLTPKPPKPRRWEIGIKAGYEYGFNNNAKADKFVFSPYLQYMVVPHVSLLFQPTYLFGNANVTLSKPAEDYYDIVSTVFDSTNIISEGDTTNFKPDTLISTYIYSKVYDSTRVSYQLKQKQVWDIELPLMLQYDISKNFSVYGGASFNFSKVLSLQQNRFNYTGFSLIDTVITTQTYPANQNPPLPPQPQNPANYFGSTGSNGTPVSQLQPFNSKTQNTFTRVGFMLGFRYTFVDRYMIDVLFKQAAVNKSVITDPDLQKVYSQPYMRITLGYKLYK